MRPTRLVLVATMLALFAFATMAPHWTTWDSVRTTASWDTEIVALSLTRGGQALHGDAEITLKFRDEATEAEILAPATVRFTARCVAPLCGGFDVGPVMMQGNTRFSWTTGEAHDPFGPTLFIVLAFF